MSASIWWSSETKRKERKENVINNLLAVRERDMEYSFKYNNIIKKIKCCKYLIKTWNNSMKADKEKNHIWCWKILMLDCSRNNLCYGWFNTEAGYLRQTYWGCQRKGMASLNVDTNVKPVFGCTTKMIFCFVFSQL